MGVVFCEFCTQKGFSEAFFSVFPAFTNLQNPFPVQTHREGVLTICGFIVNAPGRGFQKNFLLGAFATHLHREGVLTICGFIVNAPGRGFGDGKGFYDLWLYSKCTGKGF